MYVERFIIQKSYLRKYFHFMTKVERLQEPLVVQVQLLLLEFQ